MSRLNDQLLDGPPTDPAEIARMHRQTRICVWIIMIGLANFIAFVIGYWSLWGEALNGRVEAHGSEVLYFLHTDKPVGLAGFIYSGIHSISIWITVGAVMLAMLTLAKERITSSMRVTIVRGRTLITILATIITLTVTIVTIVTIVHFIHKLRHPTPPRPPAAISRLHDDIS